MISRSADTDHSSSVTSFDSYETVSILGTLVIFNHPLIHFLSVDVLGCSGVMFNENNCTNDSDESSVSSTGSKDSVFAQEMVNAV